MNTQEFLKNAIITDTKMNLVQKNIAQGQLERAFEEMQKQRELISDIRGALYQGDRYIIDEVFEMDEIYVIFKASNRKDNDVYYRTYNKETKKTLNEVSHTVHGQILVTLGNHYEGGNSRFAGYAEKMLGIVNE